MRVWSVGQQARGLGVGGGVRACVRGAGIKQKMVTKTSRASSVASVSILSRILPLPHLTPGLGWAAGPVQTPEGVGRFSSLA